MKIFMALAISTNLIAPAFATTGMHVRWEENGALKNAYAISTGWYWDVIPALTLNQRNVLKEPEYFYMPGNRDPWLSKYASVTHTSRGKEFASTGINEKGLLIHTAMLNAAKMPYASLWQQEIFILQWVQFHLDTAATVDEVIERTLKSKKAIMPVGPIIMDYESTHYQVCDALARCAGFDFFRDRVEIFTEERKYTRTYSFFYPGKVESLEGNTFPYHVISNAGFAKSIETYRNCSDKKCDFLPKRMIRYIHLVNAESGFPAHENDPVKYLMNSLQGVNDEPPITLWNVVYLWDQNGFEILYKHPDRPLSAIQHYRFNKADFDCNSKSKLWWVDLSKPGGDYSDRFEYFTRQHQQKMLEEHRRFYPDFMIDSAVEYPEKKTRCQR